MPEPYTLATRYAAYRADGYPSQDAFWYARRSINSYFADTRRRTRRAPLAGHRLAEILGNDDSTTQEFLDALAEIPSTARRSIADNFADRFSVCTCDHCGDYVANDSTSAIDGSNWCQICVEAASYYWESDGENHSEPEPEPEPEDEINSYGTGGERCHRIGPDHHPILRDCGLELEFCGARGDVFNALDNTHYVASVESDGSLDDDGAEIVTHYGTLGTMLEAVAQISKTVCRYGCRSHQTSCCGLHVSLDRKDLSTVATARFVVFWNSPKNTDWLKKFARRWGETYCYPKTEKSAMPENELDLRPILSSQDRYELVNLQNADRLEVRAFRGTTKQTTIAACVALSVWLLAYCEHTSNPLTIPAFSGWLAGQIDPTTTTITNFLKG